MVLGISFSVITRSYQTLHKATSDNNTGLATQTAITSTLSLISITYEIMQ